MAPASDELLMIEAFDPRRGKIEADAATEKSQHAKRKIRRSSELILVFVSEILIAKAPCLDSFDPQDQSRL